MADRINLVQTPPSTESETRAQTGVSNGQPVRPRHPEWIRVRAPFGEKYTHLKGLVQGLRLHTVCQEALCPNVGECWGAGTLTIMILGDVCTRACRFCKVKSGNPNGILDPDEPAKVARACSHWDGRLEASRVPILKAWQSSSDLPIYTYMPGSWGPQAADNLMRQDGRSWHDSD